ncbi:hypothetical protein [uncultured Thiodictyon sp.]|uniref:hypothetical protein n=1 Tax=uncultured Thiodictyon sp. TaxID=1846217 RepID=UPI0025CC4836|nr:hypothetical protein [uncultured Thiodictyon sp.]
MTQRRSIWFALCCISAAALTATDTAGAQPDMIAAAGDTAELARQYRQYRRELQAGSAARQAQLRDWRGPLHEVMASLRERLASGRHTYAEVLALMGPPDQTIAAGSAHNGRPVPPGTPLLIYWWRGGHDCLELRVRAGLIESAQWYYAGE